MGVSRSTREKIISVIAETTADKDEVVANRHGLTKRTIERYRSLVRADETLRHAVARRCEEMAQGWSQEIPRAIDDALRYIRKAAKTEEISPEMIHAVAGALKVVTELALSWKVIDARLASEDRRDGQPDEPVATNRPVLVETA